MKKFLKHLFVATLALVLLTATCAAAGAPVTSVNEAVPGLGASAIDAETDLPK